MCLQRASRPEQLMLFTEGFREIKPRWIVAENVPGILRIAADDVCSDLERQGYEVGIWDFEAAAVGAKHRRERIFFVAHSRCALRQRVSEKRDLRESHETRNAYATERPGSSYAPDTVSSRCKTSISRRLQATHSAFGLCGRWESVASANPGMDRVANGISNRVDRLKALGNAVVPQQAYPVFRAIIDADEQI